MSEVYLGEAPSYVKDWCKRNTYLTIEALNDGVNVNIYNRTYMYETFQVQLNDNGWKDISWKDIGRYEDYDLVNVVADKSSMSKGDKLQFRNIDKFATLKIVGSNAEVYGDLTKSIQTTYFYSMFKDSTSLTDASRLNLANITPTYECYSHMFEGCTSLVNAPALPATTLADRCYADMFLSCTSLITAPSLPATTLADRCYWQMFSNCTSLVNAPQLPATTLADICYTSMFLSCIQITDLYFPKSLQNDETFLKMTGAPTFGADKATAHFDL